MPLIESLVGKLIDQAPALALVLLLGYFAMRWVKEQIANERENLKAERENTKAEREEKNRCFEMHEALREVVTNNTEATKATCAAIEANTEALRDMAKERTYAR